MAGCEEDDLTPIGLLFDWPKSRQKVLANFKLAVSKLNFVLIFGSNSKIRRVRLSANIGFYTKPLASTSRYSGCFYKSGIFLDKRLLLKK